MTDSILVFETDNISFLSLPVFYTPYFKYKKRISDKDFILKYRYNSEADFWSLGFYDVFETPIIKSVKIRTGRNLLSNYIYNLNLPQTQILCFNLEDMENYPSQYNIDEKYKIGYYNIIAE